MSSVPPPGSRPELPEPAGDPTLAPAWAPWTAFVALVAAFGVALVGAVLIGGVGAAFGADLDDPPPAVNIVATFVQDAAFIGMALLFARRVGRLVPAQFGLRPTPAWRAIGWMALAFASYLLLSFAWGALIDVNEPDNLPESLGVDESTVALVAVCVLVTVVAPIAEELLFRGYMFGALRNWRGPWVAALITGALFGAIHAGSTDAEFLLPLAILGVALALLRWRTASLLPCIALHAFNNGIAFASSEDWSGGQGVLLIAGAITTTMVVARPFLDRAGGRAQTLL
jgi:membrane protease YdiL (CAAX protease family)